MKFYNEIVNPETDSKIKFVFSTGSKCKAITSDKKTRTITYFCNNVGEVDSKWLFNFYNKLNYLISNTLISIPLKLR